MDAEIIARALGGHRAGAGWIAKCPAHDDRTPSLSIRETDDGRILVNCFAGCEGQRVIVALRGRNLWPCDDAIKLNRVECAKIELRPRSKNQANLERARQIWNECIPASGTPAHRYLIGRGISISLPPSLRFHPELWHPQSKSVHPSLVGEVTGVDGQPMGIHRTFLSKDGKQKADVGSSKLMLGPTAGGAVKFGRVGPRLLVGEGIETCLSAFQATQIGTWAALSTSGLRALVLPQEVTDIIILADGDHAGEAAAKHAADTWKSEGRRVRLARPPPGCDFNDLLLDEQTSPLRNQHD